MEQEAEFNVNPIFNSSTIFHRYPDLYRTSWGKILMDACMQCRLQDTHHQPAIVAGEDGGYAPEALEYELVQGSLLVQALDVGVLRLQAQSLSQAVARLDAM